MYCYVDTQRGTRSVACAESRDRAHNRSCIAHIPESKLLDVLALTLSEKPVGTDHSLRNLALPLRARDIIITLAGPPDTALQHWWNDAGLWYLPLDLPPRTGFRPSGGAGFLPFRHVANQIPRTTASVRAITRAARDFDVIHSNWLFTHIDAVLAGNLSRTPVILELHDLLPVGPGRHAASAAVTVADHSVAVSNAVMSQLSASAQKKTTVIHQGVDTQRFQPGPRDEAFRALLSGGHPASFVCAIVGRQDPSKGLHTAIEAVAQLRDDKIDVHLALVGAPGEDSGEYASDMRQLAQQLLGSAHTFIDHVSDVPSVLRSVDAVLVPSIDEPFGLIALEAQATGLPVIASNSGGLPEFVRDRDSGLIATTGDADSFASALREVALSKANAQRLGNKARALADNSYRIQQRADAFAQVYGRAVRGFS